MKRRSFLGLLGFSIAAPALSKVISIGVEPVKPVKVARSEWRVLSIYDNDPKFIAVDYGVGKTYYNTARCTVFFRTTVFMAHTEEEAMKEAIESGWEKDTFVLAKHSPAEYNY